MRPLLPTTFMAGGLVSLSNEIPLLLGRGSLNESHKTAIRILEEIDPQNPALTTPLPIYSLIDAVQSEIEKIFVPAMMKRNIEKDSEKRLLIAMGLHLSYENEDGGIDVLYTCETMGNLYPACLEEDDTPGHIKRTVFDTIHTTLAGALPLGSKDDLVEEVGSYYWGGEMTDKNALQYMNEMEMCQEDDEEPLLPSSFTKGFPLWMKRPGRGPVPEDLKCLLIKARKAREALKKLKKARSGDETSYEIACKIDESYEDRSHVPPVWMYPDTDAYNKGMEIIGQYGMETGFSDISEAARISNLQDLKKFLKILKATNDVIQIGEDMLNWQHNKPKASHNEPS